MLSFVLQIIGIIQCVYGAYFAIKLYSDERISPFTKISFIMNIIGGLLLIDIGILARQWI